MANIPVNPGGVILTAGNAISGTFAGLLSLGTGGIGVPTSNLTGSFISGMKYVNGYTVISSPTGSVYRDVEVSTPSAFSLTPGTNLELIITSCSLAANSAPVLLYT